LITPFFDAFSFAAADAAAAFSPIAAAITLAAATASHLR